MTAKKLPPPFAPAPTAPSTAPASGAPKPKPTPATAYEAERHRAASQKIFESMERRLHGQRPMTKTDGEHDPHEW